MGLEVALKIPIISYIGNVFYPIRLNIFMGTKKTIIYRLLIHILAGKLQTFGGKMGVATTLAPKGLGPQDPTTKLAHWVDLWINHYLKKVFSKSMPDPPSKRLKELKIRERIRDYSLSDVSTNGGCVSVQFTTSLIIGVLFIRIFIRLVY